MWAIQQRTQYKNLILNNILSLYPSVQYCTECVAMKKSIFIRMPPLRQRIIFSYLLYIKKFKFYFLSSSIYIFKYMNSSQFCQLQCLSYKLINILLENSVYKSSFALILILCKKIVFIFYAIIELCNIGVK